MVNTKHDTSSYESIFENNLSTMTVSDGETETQYSDVEFIQQQEWVDGSWYLAFRELSENEKKEKAVNAKLQAIEQTLGVMLTGEVN